MVTVFNFFPRGPATISNEPLEMGKVEMGNGIGCISGGRRKGEPERSLTFHLSDLLLTSLSLSLHSCPSPRWLDPSRFRPIFLSP